MSNPITGLPGRQTERTASYRRIFLTDSGQSFLAPGRYIEGAKSRDPGNTPDVDMLRPGLLMGKVTSGGKYAPSIIGVTTALYTSSGSGNTTVAVSAATAAELVRRVGSTGTFKLVGPPTANGTVAVQTITYSGVNTSTGAITITAGSANSVAGSWIQPTDGSETILTFIPDGYPLQVTDQDRTTSVDVDFPLLPTGGQIEAAQLLSYGTDTSLQSRIKTQLRAFCIGWTFNDDF
jgi:hypothetical protein